MFEGYFLIADISGYTLYLSKSELDHAEKTLSALLSLLVEQTRPPLVISRLEGDAVVSYAFREHFVSGQTLVEMLENTYVAFRKAIERMVLNTTCTCNACANISTLDLKFFFHFGSFAIQTIGGHVELVGSDVILIHRLLKNQVKEQLGYNAYTLYTDAAIRALGIDQISQTMDPHEESYADAGDVKVWVQDMQPVWENKKNTSQVSIPQGQILQKQEITIDMPPERVWDYLNIPDFRSLLMGSDRTEVVRTTGGRIGPGSVYQCYHGKEVIPQTILEWQPFEKILIEQVLPFPIPNTTLLSEFNLIPTSNGTLLVCTDSRPLGPLLGRLIIHMYSRSIEKKTREQLHNFKRAAEADFAAQKESAAQLIL